MFETNTPHFKECVSWVSFAAAKWTLHLVPFGLGKVFPFTIIRNRAKGLQCTSVYPWGSVTLASVGCSMHAKDEIFEGPQCQ